MKGFLFLIFTTVSLSSYLVEYCKNRHVGCTIPTSYENICGLVEHFKDDELSLALDFCNTGDNGIDFFNNGFKFVALYNVTKIELKKVYKERIRIVKVDKEETYKAEELEL